MPFYLPSIIMQVNAYVSDPEITSWTCDPSRHPPPHWPGTSVPHKLYNELTGLLLLTHSSSSQHHHLWILFQRCPVSRRVWHLYTGPVQTNSSTGIGLPVLGQETPPFHSALHMDYLGNLKEVLSRYSLNENCYLKMTMKMKIQGLERL